MTIQDLLQIPDTEFLQHPEIRHIYWRAMGKNGLWDHLWCRTPGKCMVGSSSQYYTCAKCGIELLARTSELPDTCLRPDYIPGSLPDAVEALRAELAEKWLCPEEHDRVVTRYSRAIDAIPWTEEEESVVNDTVLTSPKVRLVVFAAALGALELMPKEKE